MFDSRTIAPARCRCQLTRENPAVPSPLTPGLVPGALADTIGYRLRVAQLAAYRRFEATLAPYGAAPRYFGLLAIIGQHPGQAQSRLAESISVQRSSLVAIIDRLAAEGLVERRPSATDRRVNAVWLTALGERVLAELTARAEAEEARLTAGMSPAERAALVRLLGQVIDNLR